VLELKAPGGRSTEAQATIAAMEAAGAFTALAEGLDCALAVLEAWGLLRGQQSRGGTEALGMLCGEASITADKLGSLSTP
jgi:hypothetical protein